MPSSTPSSPVRSRLRRPVAALAALLAAGLAGPSLAATLVVPDDYATIMDAVNAAAPVGDVIEVRPGTYPEQVTIGLGKIVTIIGTGTEPGDVVIGEGLVARPLYVRNGASLTMRNVRLTDGSAGNGGGVLVDDAALLLEDAIIEDSTGTVGGGVHGASATVTIRRTIIRNNSASAEGAGLYFEDSSAILEDCLLRGHFGSGSTIRVLGGQLSLVRTRIRDNETDSGSTISGGAGAVITLENTLVAGNTSDQPIGTTTVNVAVELVNVTLADNASTVYRLFAGDGDLSIVNSIIIGDVAQPMSPVPLLDAAYTLANGVGLIGPGVLVGDPLFKPETLYELDAGSPCVDAADSTALFPDFDLLGEPRLVDDLNVADSGAGPVGHLDMGAIERRPKIRYVDDSATGTGSGLRWADAINDLQDALDEAVAGDVEEIWIAAGTYKPDQGTDDPDRTFALVDGVDVIGGFAGTEERRDAADPDANAVILSGELGPPGADGNSKNVVTAENLDDVLVAGLIIQRGANVGAIDPVGAGLRIVGGSPRFEDLWVRQCEAVVGPSAIAGIDTDAVFVGLRVNRNGTESSAVSTIEFAGGSPRIANALVYGNHMFGGAAIYFVDTVNARLINATVYGNVSGGWCGGVFNTGTGNPTIDNSILWENVGLDPQPGAPLWEAQLFGFAFGDDGDDVRFSTFPYVGSDGDGNNSLAPDFVDPAGPDGIAGTGDDDFRLAAGSAMIDAGDNGLVPAVVTTDVAGGPRFLDDAGTPDEGAGTAPIVDRGAHEFDGTTCVGDVDGDGAVGFGDLLEVLAAWGACAGCAADVDGNAVVDFADLLVLLAAWGDCA